MSWRHLPVSNIHGNIFKYITTCQVPSKKRHLWKWGRIINQQFFINAEWKLQQSGAIFCHTITAIRFVLWAGGLSIIYRKRILTVLVIWITCAAIKICTLMPYWCAFWRWRNPQPAWLDICWSVQLEILSQVLIKQMGWKCRLSLELDGGKSDWYNEQVSLLESISTVYKPSLGTQSAVRPKPDVYKTSNRKEYPKKGADPG